MWCSHDYYLNRYLGGRAFLPDVEVISCAAFSDYERRARIIIRRYTGEVDEITDDLRDCVCAVIELLHASEDAQTLSGVAAEKTGDLSITYESAAARIESNNANVREVIYNYLSGTGLLYRGVSE